MSDDPELLLEAAALSEDFGSFCRSAWPHVVSDPLDWSWYMEALCAHVGAWVEGRIRNLIVNMPPRMGKSTICSVMAPAWSWTRRPDMRWLTSSYVDDFATRDALATRRLLESEWFRARWGWMVTLDSEEGAKSRYSVVSWRGADGLPCDPGTPGAILVRGGRVATSTRARAMGEGGHRRTADDPNNTKKAESPVDRNEVNTWWVGVMGSRTAGDPTKAGALVCQQRTNEGDLSGFLLKRGGYEHFCLPMEFDGVRRTTSLGEYDPRQHRGELLDPLRYPAAEVGDFDRPGTLKHTTGPYLWAAQYQQNPSPANAGILRPECWRFWRPRDRVDLDAPVKSPPGPPFPAEGLVYPPPREAPSRWSQECLSVDAAFKDEAEDIRKGKPPDPTALGAFGRNGADCAIIEQIVRRMDVVQVSRELLAMSRRRPGAVTKLIEDKANGPAIMQLLRRNLAGITPVTPTTSKVSRVVGTAAATDRDRDARAMSVAALQAAGNILLPHPDLDVPGPMDRDGNPTWVKAATWVWLFIAECAAFPNGENDDRVDMLSQAVTHLRPWAWIEEDRARMEVAREKDLPPAESTGEIMRRRMEATLVKERDRREQQRQAMGRNPTATYRRLRMGR